MLTASLLRKKRDGGELDEAEIRFLIEGFCGGAVSDEQMAAFAMAVCIRGMSPREISHLTKAMLESGTRIDRIGDRPRVDKHSTGGLGDKVSLILAPLLSCCGVDVPMISGRGLGITGGTLDKLESIDGFQTSMSAEQSGAVLKQVGAFIVGANETVAPADRRLYAIRDVTGTVESVALITASILSKKLSANLDALAMDVKLGSGAFMKDEASACELAKSLIRVGSQSGLPTSALLSDMDQPLGEAVGNAIEVNEAIKVLEGGQLIGGANDVRQLTVELCADLLVQVKIDTDVDSARQRLNRKLDDGSAMERWNQMVAAQGGTVAAILPLHSATVVEASESGYVNGFDCVSLGETVIAMGGGRRKRTDQIDHASGLCIHARIGDRVERGQPLLTLHCPPSSSIDYVRTCVQAIRLASHPVSARPTVIRHV